jgi:hypothetical protein
MYCFLNKFEDLDVRSHANLEKFNSKHLKAEKVPADFFFGLRAKLDIMAYNEDQDFEEGRITY